MSEARAETRDTILYLDGFSVSFDGFRALNNLSLYVLAGAVSLVNVNLSNVLNDLALDLNIDRANIPINAQVPITIAANVCGVSINILSVSAGNQAICTATSTSPELSQVVQQQLSAGGDVGGGSQTSGDTTSGTQTEPPEEDPPQ